MPGRPQIVIAGGGHVAQAIARQAQLLDFDVTILEDRPEFSSPERFGGARVLAGHIPDTINTLEYGWNSYIVIATRGHKLDADCLLSAVRTNARYIGLLGSRRKAVLVVADAAKTKACRNRASTRFARPSAWILADARPPKSRSQCSPRSRRSATPARDADSARSYFPLDFDFDLLLQVLQVCVRSCLISFSSCRMASLSFRCRADLSAISCCLICSCSFFSSVAQALHFLFLLVGGLLTGLTLPRSGATLPALLP